MGQWGQSGFVPFLSFFVEIVEQNKTVPSVQKGENYMDINLKKLEYDKILEILSKYCVTYMGKELARNLRLSNSREEVQDMIDETFEVVNLSYRNSMPGFYEIDSIDIEIKNLESNNTLSCKSLINLKNIFKLAKELKEYFLYAETETYCIAHEDGFDYEGNNNSVEQKLFDLLNVNHRVK